DGCLKEVSARGHAGFGKKGQDIVCAAESFLLRTAIAVLESSPGCLILAKDASRRGELFFRVVERGCVSVDRLRCVADFIRDGMQSLSEEYPECICFRELGESECAGSDD
ncbi:MAG: ribosomal-processing cysteine protease Prp, partial [Treponema sp.]|nr:ribosomal-processing cysteine protease Prp [Treponema sp.]